MKLLMAATAFLTRAPLPARWNFDAQDIGRSTVFFPLVGAGLGACAAAMLWLLQSFSLVALSRGNTSRGLTPLVVAVILVAFMAWATGALHLDGLADMADGFGGGYTRADVLRIMRDHVIGAYGGVTLVLVLSLKIAAIAALIERGHALVPLILAPALARWASVPLGFFLPYARRDEAAVHKVEGGMGLAITDYVRVFEVAGATLIAAILTFALAGFSGFALWIAPLIVSVLNARFCLRRIGGITGDTMGANSEIVEACVLMLALL
jgi:cobalamin 5'-phosphate synthase/cobalamin synthase